MKNLRLKEYSLLLCVKINLITAIILFIVFISSKLMLQSFQNDTFTTVNNSDIDNVAGVMIASVLIGGLVGILLVSCSIVLPFLIPLFMTFHDNFKSLFGILICNFSISYFLFVNFTFQLALYYFLSTLIGTYFSMYLRFKKYMDS